MYIILYIYGQDLFTNIFTCRKGESLIKKIMFSFLKKF
jgi:hypothetical protein